MKIRIYLTLTLIFSILTGISCNDGQKNIKRLARIKAENLFNDGKSLCPANDSIKKEVYVLGVKYLDEDLQEQDYISYFQHYLVKQKILSNTQLAVGYPPGSDVTSFFVIYPNKSYKGAKYKLIKKVYSGIHSFKIRINRQDGSVVECNTEPINFL